MPAHSLCERAPAAFEALTVDVDTEPQYALRPHPLAQTVTGASAAWVIEDHTAGRENRSAARVLDALAAHRALVGDGAYDLLVYAQSRPDRLWKNTPLPEILERSHLRVDRVIGISQQPGRGGIEALKVADWLLPARGRALLVVHEIVIVRAGAKPHNALAPVVTACVDVSRDSGGPRVSIERGIRSGGPAHWIAENGAANHARQGSPGWNLLGIEPYALLAELYECGSDLLRAPFTMSGPNWPVRDALALTPRGGFRSRTSIRSGGQPYAA